MEVTEGRIRSAGLVQEMEGGRQERERGGIFFWVETSESGSTCY